MLPKLGLGVGLRSSHYHSILNDPDPQIKWVEVISENYMDWEDLSLDKSREKLLKYREKFPVVLHGVSASLGSTDGVSNSYLKRLKKLVDVVEPAWISDHVCFTQIGGRNSHDLLPLPYTKESVEIMVSNLHKMQEYLGRQVGIENASTYLEFAESEMTEVDFLNEVIEKSGCFLLLDINNVFVNANNHGGNAKQVLESVPHNKVQQIHVAGHVVQESLCIDTHDQNVRKEVWDLVSWYASKYPCPNYMIERDGNIPEWPVLKEELLELSRLIEGEK